MRKVIILEKHDGKASSKNVPRPLESFVNCSNYTYKRRVSNKPNFKRENKIFEKLINYTHILDLAFFPLAFFLALFLLGKIQMSLLETVFVFGMCLGLHQLIYGFFSGFQIITLTGGILFFAALAFFLGHILNQ